LATWIHPWLYMYYLTALSTIAYGRSIVLVEETGVPGENHRPVTSY
jgi:hypothetical protein